MYDSTLTLVGGSGDYVAYESAPASPDGRVSAGSTVLDVQDSGGQVIRVAGPENIENDSVEFAGDILIIKPFYGNAGSVWHDVANGTSGKVVPALPATDGVVVGPSNDGWVTVDGSNPGGVRLFDTSVSGSVTSLGVPFAAATADQDLVVRAGPDGILAERFDDDHDGDLGLAYMSYSTPGAWVSLSAGKSAPVVFCSSVSAEAVGCAAGHMSAPSADGGAFVETEVVRIPVNGDPLTVTPVSGCPGLPAVDDSATMWESGCGFTASIDRVAAAGGAVHTAAEVVLPQAQLIAAQDKVFVAGLDPDTANTLTSTAIYAFANASSAATVAVAARSSVVTAGTVALSSGRVVWQDDQRTAANTDTLWQRPASVSQPGAFALGPEAAVSSSAVAELAVSGAETALQHQPSPTSRISLIGPAGTFSLKDAQLSWGNTAALPSSTLSGDRIVYMHQEAWTLFDLRTRRRSLIVGHGHRQVVGAALWGNTLAYAENNGAVWSRDLVTGAETRVRPALPDGGDVAPAYVFAYGDEIGWDFLFNTRPQAGYRDIATGTPAVRLPASDAISQLTSSGVIYLHCPGSNSADCVSSPVETGSWLLRPYQGTAARTVAKFPQISQMSVDDGVMAYLTQAGEPSIAPLPDATTVRPRSLGDPIAPTRYVATRNRQWRSYQPYSAPLSTCSVTIRYRGNLVRRLSCSRKLMTAGDLVVQWDGTNTHGHPAKPGSYNWTAHLSNAEGTSLGPAGHPRTPQGSIQLSR